MLDLEATSSPDRRRLDRRGRWLLAAALLVSLLVRAPGIYWGWNFPSGWGLHHPDEFTHLFYAKSLIDPSQEQGVRVQSYPVGLAAMTAVPILAWRAARGELSAPFPAAASIITTGRVLNVLFGAATVLAVFLLAQQLAGDARVALSGAWWMALGGLHVSQSHFFVSDVPALLCVLLAQWLMLRDLNEPGRNATALGWAAFALGIALGLKITVAALPTLALVTLWRRPRLGRAVTAGVYTLAGFAGITLLMYSPLDLLATLREGVNDPYDFSRMMGLVVYLIDLPAILGLPLLALSLAGLVLVVQALRRRPASFTIPLLVVGLPLLVHAGFVALKLDNFPRHLVLFIPYAAMLAGLATVRLAGVARARGVQPVLLLAPLAAWQAVFIVDGERGFVHEPRNAAYEWFSSRQPAGTTYYWSRRPGLKGYRYVRFPEKGRPKVLVLEMFDVNPFLSGVGFRASYPSDFRTVFDAGPSPERMQAFQRVFRGVTEYKEVARFREGYVMPEYRLADRLLGNRSRNYLTEIVIFERTGPP